LTDEMSIVSNKLMQKMEMVEKIEAVNDAVND